MTGLVAGTRALARPLRPARGPLGDPRVCLRRVLPVILLLPLFVGNAPSVAAQPRFPLVVSGGTHSLTAPWHLGPLAKRMNLAFIVGTERTLKSGDHLRLYHTANLGFFQHYWWMTGVFLDTGLGAGYALPLGFHADLRLGIGYMHYFWRRKSLELKNGMYVQAKDWGKPSLMVPLSVVLGYRGSSTRPLAVAPFISAQWAVQALFLDEIPVMTHFFLMAGVRIEWWRAAPAAGR